jgi:type IV pilus assembly protein PilX
MPNRKTAIHKQTGVVLVTSLMILLLLTIIGLSATQVTSLEEKMAGNARDKNIAFQAAESALIAAENFVLAVPLANISSTFNSSNGLLGKDNTISGNVEPDFFLDTTWTANSSQITPLSYSESNLGVTTRPRYIIKRLPESSGTTNLFRITARGTGNVAGTQVILQVVYQRTN